MSQPPTVNPADLPVPPPITVEQHRDRVLQLVTPLPPVIVALDDADGRVLARDVHAQTAIPPFDNSAMDGYAVRAADVVGASDTAPVPLRVVGESRAGGSELPRCEQGQAVRIMTGAPMVAGADAVVPHESTDRGHETVLIRHAVDAGAHVRRRGDDLQAGDLVVAAGTQLTAMAVAAAASAGCGTLPVLARPRVGIIATGDELVEPGGALPTGRIPDSNSYLVAAAVRAAGGEAVRAGIVADAPADLVAALEQLAPLVDVLVLTGGASVGDHDVVKAVLAAAGVPFGPVLMQPGKPQGAGRWRDGTPVLALPGNPVSVAVSVELFVRPLLRRLQGYAEVVRPTEIARASGWSSPAARRQYIPVTLTTVDGVLEASPSARRGSGSHLIGSLARADGLAIVPEHITEVAQGDRVEVLRWERGVELLA